MGKAVKKVARVAIAATIGYFTGGPIGAVIAAAGALYADKGMDVGSASVNTEPSAQTVRSSKAPARFILGRVSTGGVLAFAQEESGDQTNKEKLHLVYVLCEGPIAGVDQVLLSKEDISTYGSNASYEVHSMRTTPDPYMLEHCPDWKESMIGRGISWVRITLTYDQEKFSSGIPDVQFIVRGRNDIYDPRTGTSGYSENTALHILWYLRNRCNVPDDEIIMDTFISAANVCAEAVTKPEGGTESRYATAAVIGANERRDQVLEQLEASCAGNLIMIGGRWQLQVGAYYGPADLTIDEDMVVGTVSGSAETSNADAVNTITGTFVDPTQSWAETDYPQVQVAEWVAEDGGEASESLNLPYVTSPYQAQRLANIKLRQKRSAGALSLQLNFNGYACRPGRVVNVDLPSLHINGEFVVQDWSMSSEDAVEVQLIQSDESIWDDAVGEPYDPLGFISLPTGGVPSPTNLAWETKVRGDAVQGVVSWAYSSGVATAFNVVVRDDSDDVVWSAQVPGTAMSCNVGGLDAGNYSIGVSARGATGRSGEASISITINLPPVPDRVITTIGNREVTLIPVLPAGGDLGGGTFRYYVTQSESAAQTDAEYIGQGLSFTHTGLTPLTTYYYWVQSVNAYGASGFLRVEVTTSLKFDEEFNYIEQQIEAGGTLYDTIVNAATPAAVQAAEDAVAPFQQQLDENTTAIGEFQYADEAQSIKLLLIKAADQTNRAVLNVEQTVRADIAQQVTTLQAGQAEVEDRLYAVVNEDGSFTAGAVRTVEVGDSKAILGLYTDGEVSEIGGIADRFYIYNEVSGEMVLAFVVQDGRVVMPESLIGSVTIGKLVTDTGETLIEGGKIKTKFIDVDAISAKELVSKVNGFNGRPTFALRENGSFEFNSTTSGNGGMKWDGATQIVTDDNGTTRIKIGRLS